MIRAHHGVALLTGLCCASCGPGQPAGGDRAEPAEAASPAAVQDSMAFAGPETVLDGTDVVDLATYHLLPLDPSAAGEYAVEQGGAELSLTLSATGGRWSVERTRQEPGEPVDRVVHDLTMRNGALVSDDGNLVLRGAGDGVLVLERASPVISARYWVYYYRRR